MKHTQKTKNITCRIVSKGIIMQVNTIDEILSPGQYKIDACGVTASDGFPDGVDGECLSAYLEVSDTNHSADNLKSAAVGQTLTYTDADGSTAVYHRSGTNKEGKVEWSSWSDTAALGLQDGSITAEKLSSDIRTKVESPLRPLFIAAGAEYNDSGADKTKTAPWGESVTHKAGHYYLNGLGDITEEEMKDIFYYTFPLLGSTDWTNAFREVKIRTNLFYKQYYSSNRVKIISAAFNANKKIEIINFNHTGAKITFNDSLAVDYAFGSCTNLKRVLGTLDISKVSSLATFGNNCDNLIEIKLYGLKSNLFLFNSSAYISNDTILYIIKNAMPSTAIAITLHPDAYTRIVSDSEIVTALNAQPLITLASA